MSKIELKTLLPQSLHGWDYRDEPPNLTSFLSFNKNMYCFSTMCFLPCCDFAIKPINQAIINMSLQIYIHLKITVRFPNVFPTFKIARSSI